LYAHGRNEARFNIFLVLPSGKHSVLAEEQADALHTNSRLTALLIVKSAYICKQEQQSGVHQF
jgi:hypothetical protein